MEEAAVEPIIENTKSMDFIACASEYEVHILGCSCSILYESNKGCYKTKIKQLTTGVI